MTQEAPESTMQPAREVKLADGTPIPLPAEPRACWAKLARLPLEHAVFPPGSVLRDLLWLGLNLKWVDFDGADLSGGNFAGAMLEEAKLTSAKLVRANLSGANLSRAIATQADFTGAVLTDAVLSGVQAVGATLDDVTGPIVAEGGVFKGVSARGASLAGSKLSGDWSGAIFDDARLDGARVSADNVKFVRVSFRGCSCKQTAFERVDLTGSDFTEADLKSASMSQANMTGVCLHNAKGCPADLHMHVTVGELDTLKRAAHGLGIKFSPSAGFDRGLRKLWLDHSIGGGDILTEPIEEVFLAAQAMGERYDAQDKEGRRGRF